MSRADASEIAITLSARRATVGTTACQSRTVAAWPLPRSGTVIHVVSASTTTFAARVASGAVSAGEWSTSKCRPAYAPSGPSS